MSDVDAWRDHQADQQADAYEQHLAERAAAEADALELAWEDRQR